MDWPLGLWQPPPAARVTAVPIPLPTPPPRPLIVVPLPPFLFLLSLFLFPDTHTHCPCRHRQTRMQGTRASQYAGTWDCFRQIVTKEGFPALYAGVVPRLGRVVPGQGIIFMSFESIQRGLEGNFAIFQ